MLLTPDEQLLPDHDPSTVELLYQGLADLGVEVRLEAGYPECEIAEDRVVVGVAVGGERFSWSADKLVLDGAHIPNVEDLALTAAGVEIDEQGFVCVDETQKTTNPRVYAVGDVVGGPFLASKGIYEGKVAADVICGLPAAYDATAVPMVVRGEPEIAAVGLTEEEACRAGYEVVVGRFPHSTSEAAPTSYRPQGMAVVVAEDDSGIVLGVHLAGPGVSELVAEGAHAVEMRATLEDLALTVHAHPTLSEAIAGAAEAAIGLPANTRAERVRILSSYPLPDTSRGSQTMWYTWRPHPRR